MIYLSNDAAHILGMERKKKGGTGRGKEGGRGMDGARKRKKRRRMKKAGKKEGEEKTVTHKTMTDLFCCKPCFHKHISSLLGIQAHQG